MKIQLMNVKRQHETHACEYEEAVLRVLRSGEYIGGGEVSAFEEEFAAYEEAKYGVSCGNGTDAIVLALRSLGIGVGDEVITVAWSFFATAESIAITGATPVFVDVCPDTYCMNPELVERAITERTKAVLVVHFYGQSCDMDALRAICEAHGLKLISDCAQSTGTSYRGSRKNTLGDISCFSFFPTKNLGCAGDGGIVLTDNEEIARACRSLKVHGSGKDGLLTLRGAYESVGKPIPADMPVGESKYYNYIVGYNSRLDAIQASILRCKLRHIDEFVAKRRDNAAFYNSAFANLNVTTPYEAPYGEHSYYIYALMHPKAQSIIDSLRQRGIPSGTYYPVPIHLQGAFADLSYREGDLPVTERLSRETFVLPVYPELTREERTYIVDELANLLS